MAHAEFDWIDDAFNDEKTAEDIANAKGPRGAGVLLAAASIASVLLMGFAFFSIMAIGW